MKTLIPFNKRKKTRKLLALIGVLAASGCGVLIDPGSDTNTEATASESELQSAPTTGEPLDENDGVSPEAVSTEDAYEVTAEAFALLSDLPAGENVFDLAQHDNTPGLAAFTQALFEDLPEAGSPNALCHNILAPLPSDECFVVEPKLLDAGSYDVDNESGAPLEGNIEFEIDKQEICALGDHTVTLSVFDNTGLGSHCTSLITLCDPTHRGCPEKPILIDNDPVVPVCEGSITCKWIVTPLISPEKYSLIVKNSTQHVANGPGPWHFLENGEFTKTKSCAADSEEESGPTQSGTARYDLNVICTNDAGQICEVGCKSDVEAQAFYRSKLNIRTATGRHCFGFNDTNAFAQDETIFKVNGITPFMKAVSISNGTNNSYTSSFELGAEAGKSKDGASANIGLSFGVSSTQSGNTGPLDDHLNAFGGAKQPTPVTTTLDSKGKVSVRVRRRSWGLSRVHTRGWLLYYSGTSTCPGAGSVAGGYRVGSLPTDQKHRDDVKAANNFFKTRGHNVAFAVP